MNRRIAGLRWSLLLWLLWGGTAAADGNAVYQRNSDDGTIELTNIPDSPSDYQTVVAPPTLAAAVPAGNTEAPAAAGKPVPIRQSPMAAQLKALYEGARAAHDAAGR